MSVISKGKKTRILLLVQANNYQIGGGEIAAALLANELTKMGYVIGLAAPSFHDAINEIIDESIQMISLIPSRGRGSLIFDLLRKVSFIPRLIKSVVTFNPDIIYAGSEKMGLSSLPLKYIIGIPVVLFKQFGVFENWKNFGGRLPNLFELVERKLLRLPFDAILTNDVSLNAAVKEGVNRQKLFQHSLSLMRVDNLTHSEIQLSDLGISFSDDDTILLFAARLEKVKGLHILLDALKPLPESVKLLVLGTGSEKKDLIIQTHILGLNKRVHFLGQVPYNVVTSIIRISEIVVCPSLSELLGSRTMWDAFLLKKPVVATKVGSVPRLVQNKVHAILVPPANSKALSMGIIEVMGDTGLTNEMVERAYKMAKSRASKKSTDGFIKSLNYVLRKSYQNT